MLRNINYGVWFVSCRIIVLAGRKGEKAPRENPPNVYALRFLWWLILAMSYYFVFGAKRRTGATRRPAKWWLRVFAWRPFAPPHESTTLFIVAFSPPVRRIFAWRGERSPCENQLKSPFGGFFAWRPFAFSPPKTRLYDMGQISHHSVRLLFVVSLPGGAKGRHAKTSQSHHLAGFRVATFRVFAPKTRLYDMAQISHHIKHIA